jgi:hypothetical protein
MLGGKTKNKNKNKQTSRDQKESNIVSEMYQKGGGFM